MMLKLTKDNYLYGTGSGDTWHVNIDPPKRKVKTYFEETLDAVEYVYSNKTGKFHVLFSGGMDSQYVCEVLLKMGIEFDTTIIRLLGNNNEILNQHDIINAFNFCKAKNIAFTTYDLNFIKFVDSGHITEIAKSITCASLALPGTLYVASQLDGFILLGNDPPYLRFEKNQWFLEELEYIHSLMRYYNSYSINGCPFLLSYTPEMMLSFLIDPMIVKLCTGQFPGKLGSNSTKAHVFNNGSGFNITPYDFVSKTKVKFTGYERVFDEMLDHPNLSIFTYYKTKWNGEYLEPYSNVVKRLSIYQ